MCVCVCVCVGREIGREVVGHDRGRRWCVKEGVGEFDAKGMGSLWGVKEGESGWGRECVGYEGVSR